MRKRPGKPGPHRNEERDVKITIGINTDNAVFENDSGEIGRIIRDGLSRMQTADWPEGTFSLWDTNGDHVGEIEVKT